MKNWIYSIPDSPAGYKRLIMNRILSKSIATESGCIEWQGFVTGRGYGQCYVTISGKTTTTQPHRAIWLVSVGDIRFGHEVDHLCRNRLCVNVDHLEPVLHEVNVYRANGRGRKKTPDDCRCSKHGREDGYSKLMAKG